MVYSNSGFAETINEINQANLANDGLLPAKSVRVQSENQKPGFYSHKSAAAKKTSLETVVSDLANGGEFYENTLIINVACSDEGQLPLQIPYKNKKFSWKIPNYKISDLKNKESQTDTNGRIWLAFSSRGSVQANILQIQFVDKNIDVDLARGPFEILLPMQMCKSK